MKRADALCMKPVPCRKPWRRLEGRPEARRIGAQGTQSIRDGRTTVCQNPSVLDAWPLLRYVPSSQTMPTAPTAIARRASTSPFPTLATLEKKNSTVWVWCFDWSSHQASGYESNKAMFINSPFEHQYLRNASRGSSLALRRQRSGGGTGYCTKACWAAHGRGAT